MYPVVQNFCLALRDQGVATTLTTLLCMYEPQVKELLGIPGRAVDGGVRRRRLPGPTVPDAPSRRPVEEIAFLDDFDHPLTAG